MLLLLAAVPVVYWDAASKTASDLRDAGITHIAVSEKQLAKWQSSEGISVEAFDANTAVKLDPPSVDYQINVGGATRAPWVKSNGARLMRQPQARFLCEAPGPASALCAAEAFAFGGNALIHTDAAGLRPLGAMLALLRSLPGADLQPLADIGFVDDKSAVALNVMDLLLRNNLLFRIVPSPDPRLKLTLILGSKDYPLEDAKKNPATTAHEARANLTDDRRSLRIYGSQVVIARLEGGDGRLRVHLLNYDAARRKVNGIRVRVTGRFERSQAAVADSPGVQLLDYTLDDNATEFTLADLSSYAAIDLFQK